MALPIRESHALGGSERLELPLGVSTATATPVVSEIGSVGLEIPLDLEAQKSITQERREARALRVRLNAEQNGDASDEDSAPTGYLRHRSGEPRRRDSLKRREALLKGKEGSRRRQKWENDRLLGNPAFQPPEPYDWVPHPTHPVQNVPYLLAPLWDQHYAKAARQRADHARQAATTASVATPQMPRDLKEKMKRARGAKTLLQHLEEQVRAFVYEWEDKQKLKAEGWDVDVDADKSDIEGASSEEEVVFVGRTGRTKQERRRAEMAASNFKLVYDSHLNDQDGSFGRWLVHSIAAYYNLHTWSITTGNPARREAYVGIPDAMMRRRPGSASSSGLISGPESAITLPRPLWVMV